MLCYFGIVILVVSLIITTASVATNLENHIAGVGTMAHPTSNAGIAGCSNCHGNLGSTTTLGFCTGCHSFSVFSLVETANPTTVTAGQSTSVSFTVNQANNVNVTNRPAASGATVTLSGAGVSASGTTSTSGIFAIPLTPTGAGTINAIASMAGFNQGTTAVTVTAPVPVLTTITVSPAAPTLVQGNTQAFTASPKDQFGNPIAATIVWSSSNTSVGTVSASGVLTAVSAGTTTVTATNGSVKGTAAVTVTAPSTGKATVNFVVTDSKTHRPIHEAKVSFGGKTKETDDHGIAKFTDVVLGTYNYKVSKEGYQTIKNSIKVTGDTTTVYVKMVKNTRRDSESHD